jgi:hypothetical protein
MRAIFRSIAIASIVGAFPTVCLSYPAKTFNLARLVADSDVVAIANVLSMRKAGAARITVDGQAVSATLYRAEAEIQGCIKGLCPDHVTIEFYTPEQFVGYPGVGAGRGLVFLRAQGPTFVFTDRHFPVLPAADAYTFPDEQGPVEAAAGVLGRALSSPATSHSDKMLVLVRARGIPKTESFISSLQVALGTVAQPDLRCRIQAELISRGDASQVESAVELLLGSALSRDERDTLVLAIANNASGPGALPALGKLLRLGDPLARRAAAEALWHIASPASVRFLGPSLEDPDEEVRFYAVRALSDIANEPGWGGPSESEFHENQQRYLAHWASWANTKTER